MYGPHVAEHCANLMIIFCLDEARANLSPELALLDVSI